MSAQPGADRQGRIPTVDYLRERLLAGLPMTERRLDLDGVSTALLEGGGGPPVVFLQAEFATVWMRVIRELARTHRVIAPDLPGLGPSQVSNGPPTIDRVMTWVGELIEQTCSTPPVLVGKGAAGAIAARFAVDHSDRLQALVLVDSYGPGRHRRPWGWCSPTPASCCDRPNAVWSAAFATTASPTSTACAARWVSAGTRWRHTPWTASAPRLSGLPCGRLVRLSVARVASERHGWALHVIEDARDDPAIEQPQAFPEALRTALDGSSRDNQRRRPG